MGQAGGKTEPSPVAPGDLSKPVFDTTKPVYDASARMDKGANAMVAEVEGRPITMGDVGDAIRALPDRTRELPLDTLLPIVLEQLIRQQALVVRAQQQGLDEEPSIRRKVRAVADLQLAEEYLQWAISKDITEARLLERYNQYVAGRPGPEEVHLRVILTDTEKSAYDLIAEIKGGADFASVARRASKDSTSVGGGDLEFKTRDQLNAEVGAVAFTLPVGQVSPNPVRGAAGWFILKVEERRPQPTPPYATVREQLRRDLLHDGVASAATEALKDLRIRRFRLNGEEVLEENSSVK